jgi:hypothetical protein
VWGFADVVVLMGKQVLSGTQFLEYLEANWNYVDARCVRTSMCA